ncbi:uncharacterized protein LOC117121773 [Anneissia japonica]|uniref:uncharacterized protein LOC117121773 n=1 Tax=Anneissia japonica TaxID=1529436 RepID=UPI001425745A|nr:uncharacterized protein LOC117121773 [Anneissia japonica]
MLTSLALLLLTATLALSCNPASTPPTAAPASSDSPDSQVDGETVDFFVGEVEFVDIMCGIAINRLRRSPPNPIDEYRPTHSLLRFRGQVFEWGVAPLSLRFRSRGSMNRDPSSQCITWDNAPRGKSACTLAQAQEWADNYHSTYGSYNLLLNNCHMFVIEMMTFLETGC